MKVTGEAIKKFRKQHGVNQQDFWSLFKVTQSGGSRYESGRNMPEPTQELISAAMDPENKTFKKMTRQCRDWAAIKAEKRS